MPWRPVSLAPQQSGLAILSLLAPFGVLLGTLQLSLRERRHLSVILLVVGMVSVAIGLLQVAQGPSSPLRFFEFTNPTEAVGFFANRNHFAALLYCLTLIAAAWMLECSKVIAPAPIADAAFRGRHHHSAGAELPRRSGVGGGANACSFASRSRLHHRGLIWRLCPRLP